jgi:Flp pilus assembly protein CpaB
VENLIPSRVLKTRQGTIAVGIAAAVLAAILLLVYLSHYRSSVKGSSEPVTVLVAKRLIPKGTSGAALASKNLFTVTTVPKGQLKLGAISDPGVLRGTAAATDIFPSQQLTSADFPAASTGALAAQLATTWRAVALPPLDAAHGISPGVQAGDHVDVYGQLAAKSPASSSQNVMGLLLPNVLVLATPTQAPAGSTAPVSGNYILKVPSKEAPRFLFMAQNGSIWFVLRPGNGARGTRPAFVTNNNIFGGSVGQGQVIFGGH